MQQSLHGEGFRPGISAGTWGFAQVPSMHVLSRVALEHLRRTVLNGQEEASRAELECLAVKETGKCNNPKPLAPTGWCGNDQDASGEQIPSGENDISASKTDLVEGELVCQCAGMAEAPNCAREENSCVPLPFLPPQERIPVPGLLHTAFLDALIDSRALRSPHCEGEQAKAFGAQVRSSCVCV